jgi:hypothetical protein
LSPLFTFLIGKEKNTVVVHANAIAATCDQLAVLINGNMSEANTRCAEIENIEVEDFIRFCEYAYRGDFTVPTWKQDETLSADGESLEVLVGSPEPGVEELLDKVPQLAIEIEPRSKPEGVAGVLDCWGQPLNWKQEFVLTRKKDKRPKLNIRELFDNHIYNSYGAPKYKIQSKFNPYANDTADQDFTPVFLAYARLYTFAHFRSIEPLKSLTLRKLHSTLKDFKLSKKRVGDIIKLAEYAYTADDLPSRGEHGTVDLLRQLVVEYIVCEIDTIGKYRGFVEFMEEGGEFVGDFWRILRKCYVFL